MLIIKIHLTLSLYQGSLTFPSAEAAPAAQVPAGPWGCSPHQLCRTAPSLTLAPPPGLPTSDCAQMSWEDRNHLTPYRARPAPLAGPPGGTSRFPSSHHGLCWGTSAFLALPAACPAPLPLSRPSGPGCPLPGPCPPLLPAAASRPRGGDGPHRPAPS